VKPQQGLSELAETPFTDADLALIERENAERLIPRLARRDANAC
jgi:hypothetical protein